MDRLGPLALVTDSDVVNNVRTQSRPVVPFGDFLHCFVVTKVSIHDFDSVMSLSPA